MVFNVLPANWNLPGLIFRTVRYSAGSSRELMRVELLADGVPVPATMTATPTCLCLEGGGGVVEMVFATRDVVRVQGRGVGLRLSTLNNQMWRVMPLGAGAWQLNPPAYRTQYLVTVLRGRAGVTPCRVNPKGPLPQVRPSLTLDLAPGEDGSFDMAVEELISTPTGAGIKPPFEACRAGVEAEWSDWRSGAPPLPPRYRATAELASYVNWSAAVAPSGQNKRTTLLMSKNWMTQCWSWDHCFTAMALAPCDPGLAWDQMLALFDHQDRFGCLPDSVTEGGTTWSAVKPPIHGWALLHMARHPGVLTTARLKAFYPRLEAWTEWWLTHRVHDGLPEYMNGCDSGWDNATVFDGGCPVAAPDAATYLILQLECLAVLADRLGRPRHAAARRAQAQAMQERLIERLWAGNQFVTRRREDGEPFAGGDCLINFIPVLLGARLPETCFARLAKALRPGGRFVTAQGPATESPASELYEANGYWRGPIWAPETLMLVDGLNRGGATDQARALARRFADMCVRSGLAENFDARTGAALCDPAYTWTSSVFLILARDGMLG